MTDWKIVGRGIHYSYCETKEQWDAKLQSAHWESEVLHEDTPNTACGRVFRIDNDQYAYLFQLDARGRNDAFAFTLRENADQWSPEWLKPE